jgi:hypothetical protein
MREGIGSLPVRRTGPMPFFQPTPRRYGPARAAQLEEHPDDTRCSPPSHFRS